MGQVSPKLKDELRRLLRQEMSRYRALLNLLRQEKKALIDHALFDLTETNRLKKDLIQDLRKTEADRETLVSALAEALGVPPDEVTLSRVTARLEGEDSADLSESGENLASLLTLCRDIGRENTILLEHSFDLVGSLISTLTDPEEGHTTYLPSGQVQGNQAAGHLVARQA